jgi:hypothetical protein
MGGGTCYNGGWLPPGMVPPSGGTVSPTTTSTSTVLEPASTDGCTTPDPFASIEGLVGLCQNGGWIPIQGQTGTIHLSADGTWEIVGDDGTTYVPVDSLDLSLQVNDLRVFFAGLPLGTEDGATVIQLAKITAL